MPRSGGRRSGGGGRRAAHGGRHSADGTRRTADGERRAANRGRVPGHGASLVPLAHVAAPPIHVAWAVARLDVGPRMRLAWLGGTMRRAVRSGHGVRR
ncbi:MAG: hypothetical protein D6705_13075 [Deltaproteobacteria bacterium]|nr:MAG: hypothetical protein D6705_13075 [Deltaproteobacteria bacterium]